MVAVAVVVVKVWLLGDEYSRGVCLWTLTLLQQDVAIWCSLVGNDTE